MRVVQQDLERIPVGCFPAAMAQTDHVLSKIALAFDARTALRDVDNVETLLNEAPQNILSLDLRVALAARVVLFIGKHRRGVVLNYSQIHAVVIAVLSGARTKLDEFHSASPCGLFSFGRVEPSWLSPRRRLS